MRQNLRVHIPKNNNVSYSLYAYGIKSGAPSFDRETESVVLDFETGTVVVILYYFQGFERGYVVTGWENDKNGNKYVLPGVEGGLHILFTAIGRELKALKRVLQFLTRYNETAVFRNDLLFWYRICALIRAKKTRRTNILHLLYKTKYGMREINGIEDDICTEDAV